MASAAGKFSFIMFAARLPTGTENLDRAMRFQTAVKPSVQALIGYTTSYGFRILAGKNDKGVRLLTRNSYNFADSFPMIVAAPKIRSKAKKH